jgi:AcrR family transcriptional regulator
MVDGRIEKGRATRDRLLTAGRELFGERGYDRTSIEAILERAGVARGALYHHFPTKEALFDAVLERLIVEIAERAARAARGADDPIAALRAGFGSWLEMAIDPAVQRIGLLDAPAVVGWSRWRELDEQYTLGALRRNLQLIAEQDRLRTGDVDLLAHMLLAAVSEAALKIARAPDPPAELPAAQEAVDTVISGLLAP